MSMSIPYFFEPFQLVRDRVLVEDPGDDDVFVANGLADRIDVEHENAAMRAMGRRETTFRELTERELVAQRSVIIDGGTLSNFPVWLFDVNDPGRPLRRPTFGFTLTGGKGVGGGLNAAVGRMPWAVRFGFDIFHTSQEAWDARFVSHSSRVRTVTVNAAGETTTTTSPSPPRGSEVAPSQQGPVSYGHGSGAGASPLAGSASGAVRLASRQHGRSVRGSLDISPAGAGGRLEVDLLARSAVLASAGHSAQVRVGRLVRLHVRAGRVSFAVALTARAREALRRHGRLPLTARLLISAPTGASVTIARKLLMRP